MEGKLESGGVCSTMNVRAMQREIVSLLKLDSIVSPEVPSLTLSRLTTLALALWSSCLVPCNGNQVKSLYTHIHASEDLKITFHRV